MRTLKLPFYARLAFILVILIATAYICIVGQRLIVPLLFSFLFAMLLLPVANFFESRARLSRSLASIIAVILLLVVISLIIYLLAFQITNLSSEWPSLKKQIEGLFHNIQTWMATTFHVNLARQATYINNTTSNLLKSSGAILEKTVLSVSSIILLLVFILIYTILLLFYRRILMRFIVALCTEKYISIIYDILENIKHIIRKYIAGLFLEMAIVAIIACLIFWILGIKYVFLLGLLVGILNVIPYLGIFTALVLSILITFATSDAKHALFVAIAVICIHLVDSNFLMPKIVGSQVKINPLIVIIGVIIGEMLFGISGMFLSIPYLAIAKVIFDRIEGMQPWGILLGEEEHTPKKIKRIIQEIKKKE
ncbi:MAG: AI-2E family transporter [Chitinophagaceae bacterium]